MTESGTYKIRPAGRHLLTIGRDLIQDSYAAIVELIKNAYDADSPSAIISIVATGLNSDIEIIVKDEGHGMTRDVVANRWLVPSTRDKLNRKTSPNGRTMQGRKGVGRYAASMLGESLLMETVSTDGIKTTVFVVWEEFSKKQFLDEVDVLIESEPTNKPSGTTLTIAGAKPENWTKTQLEKLERELKKLISPVENDLNANDASGDFAISLDYKLYWDLVAVEESKTIKPYPIFSLYDYAIEGTISADGNADIYFKNQKTRNTTTEKVSYEVGGPTHCGLISFKIHVYDRDKDGIGQLINRGLKDSQGNYLGKNEARRLLNDFNGIGVYRNGFRIRPLGDSDFDWLELNRQRIQKPSVKIGDNQVIGYVLIESEEKSGLEEKSARDGLKDNLAFSRLKKILSEVISELEQRRFIYRQKEGLGRKTVKIERELNALFEFDSLKHEIGKKLESSGIAQTTIDDIVELISTDEKGRNRIADDLRKAVARYQGQATLGKIVSVVLHESRKPLAYFNAQIPNWYKFADLYIDNPSPELHERLQKISKGVSDNVLILRNFFNKLDPLSTRAAENKQLVDIKKDIFNATQVFQSELDANNIEINVIGVDDISIMGWKQDIYIVFANLIENSIFWINAKGIKDGTITIDIQSTKGKLSYIDYRDNGPGIDPRHIVSGAIFEPEFSTKPQGSGLGLAIAGEASNRCGLELNALESDTGAYFRLEPLDINNNG